MTDDPQPQKIPLIFYATSAGSVAQTIVFRRLRLAVTGRPQKAMAHPTVLLCLHGEHLVALHGFIKKTRATPAADLVTARRRHKELER